MLVFADKFPKKNKKSQMKAPGRGGSEHKNAKNRFSFVKDCARREGVSLNEKIWAQIEKIIETKPKW